MALGSTRKYSHWYNSQGDSISPLSGFFVIEISPTLMSSQSIIFLKELGKNQPNEINLWDADLLNLVKSTFMYSQSENQLIFSIQFNDGDELKQFNIKKLNQALQKLELYLDITFFVQEISYNVINFGQRLKILIFIKEPVMRGLSFRIEERGLAQQSIMNSKAPLLNFEEQINLGLAQKFYSVGLASLSLEDQVIGILDSAFNQFYLAIECITQEIDRKKAQEKIIKTYSDENLAKIISHVYEARGMYFMHVHPKSSVVQKAQMDYEMSALIAKQILVARWGARKLISLALQTELLNREMRLYFNNTESLSFDGKSSSLESEFKIPKI